jgi:homoserine O-acetyltransferase
MLMRRSSACDVEVQLPAELQGFGGSVRARLSGYADGPVIVALGGISGNRFVCGDGQGREGWWRDLVGQGCAVDPARHRILGIDFIADPAGERAPSTRDQAEAVCVALSALEIEQAYAIVGASYGGMVALSLAQHFPDRVGRLVAISADASPFAAATAMRELQRRIVALGLETGRGPEALAIARGIAMMGYRTPEEFAQRFRGGISDCSSLTPSEPGLYLRARGAAFLEAMSPQRFLSLSASIDRHFVDPAVIGHPCLLIGAMRDQVVPPEQLRSLASGLGGPVELHLLECLEGHDMFLKKAGMVSGLIKPFLEQRS